MPAPMDLLFPGDVNRKIDYPTYYTFPTPAALLATLLVHQDKFPNPDGQKSILVSCAPSKGEFFSSLLEDTSPTTHPDYLDQELLDQPPVTSSHPISDWIRSDDLAKVRWIIAASMIEIVHAPTLTHLRALLSALHSTSTSPPLLAISSFLDVHQRGGELAAQGVSRTLAAAMETTNGRLLIGDAMEVDTQMPMLNAGAGIGLGSASTARTASLKRVLGMWIRHWWNAK
ncbi:hypothetical protein SAICODRAFT_70631 [Saitoella complicata NRRL Y-17804]|uniref:uncharacterized protein n=1 Tax=Saitoella complicata (strain BCRC 22490 / CBS 7301 / JCM 7358 / NBRC 10748 / NRRL Y-17804) TaxID=698492 RepID=UPI0008668DC7|nr:uncharacterized protein SAICODRAFT_70631 [Saitoella complicata NRRL Y-17804]ODQ53939.1 hypothetical protein SAICODRAFT_70631 [Saitoella complicata NRRL Y-17804]